MAKKVRHGPKVRSALKRGVRRRDERDDPELAPPEPLLAPNDDLGEELAEEYLISATSGEQAAEDIRNQETPEERGGPFVETTSAQEIDYEDDEPEDSEAEPFPTATRQDEQ